MHDGARGVPGAVSASYAKPRQSVNGLAAVIITVIDLPLGAS